MIIKGRGFILRDIKMADAQEYFECHQDAEARKNFMAVPETLGAAKKIIRKNINGSKKKKPTNECFAIEVSGKYAGHVELNDLNKKHFEHRGEVVYCLHPDFRGKGLVGRALKLVVKHGFNKYKLKRLEGWCRSFNKASGKTLKNAGFKLDGIFRKNKCKDGKYMDDMIWSIVR